MATKPTMPTTRVIADPDKADGGLSDILANPDQVLRDKGDGTLAAYTEVLRDDQVKSCLQQRIRAVVQTEWHVAAASESAADKAAADGLKEQLKRIDFDAATEKMLYSLFYGYAVAEVIWSRGEEGIDFRLKVRDPDRFRFGRKGQLYKKSMTSPMGEKMPPRKFWVASQGATYDDNPYGIGLAHWLYWPVFFKRNGMKFWLIFLEKFGQPTATAKMSQAGIQDPRTRKQALEALASIQADSGVLIPEGIEIELLEAARSGAADYESLSRAMDAAISKIILSQTMTTDNGSSKAQAEVHQDVKNEVIKADADLICQTFNQSAVTWWSQINHPLAAPPSVWRNTEPPEDLAQRVERDKGIAELGFEPTEDYIREVYGEGWQKKQAQQPPLGAPGAPPADFADPSRIVAQRNGHRADQEAIAQAARQLAGDYDGMVGDRVRRLLGYAEETGDLETFKERITEMLAEGPDEQAADKIAKASIIGRLLGRTRATR